MKLPLRTGAWLICPRRIGMRSAHQLMSATPDLHILELLMHSTNRARQHENASTACLPGGLLVPQMSNNTTRAANDGANSNVYPALAGRA